MKLMLVGIAILIVGSTFLTVGTIVGNGNALALLDLVAGVVGLALVFISFFREDKKDGE